jgi:hypothetical protein
VARAQEKAESVLTEKTIETLERWKNHHGTLSEKAEGASFEARARIEAVLHDVIREPQGAEVTGGLVFAGVMLLAFFVAGLSDPPWEGDDE